MVVMSGVGSVKPTTGIPCQFCSKNSNNGHCCTSSSSPQSSSPSLSPSLNSTPTQQEQQKRRNSSSLRRNHNSYDRKSTSTSTPTRTTKKIIFGINIGNGEPCLNCLRMGDFCKAHENQRRKNNVMNGTALSSSMSPRSVIIPPPPPPLQHRDINSIHSSYSSSSSRKNDAKEIKRNNATSPRKQRNRQQQRQNKFSSPSSFSSSPPKPIKISSSEVRKDGRGMSNRHDYCDCKKRGGKEGGARRRTNHSQYHQQKHHHTMMRQCFRPSIPNPPPFGLNNDEEEGESSSTTNTNATTTTTAAVHSKKKENIIKLKKEATNLLNNCKNQTSSSFGKKDYAGSITKLTLAIQETMSCVCDDKFCSDDGKNVYNYYLELLVVLFSNRAAGLFDVGANRAAIDDCRQALDYLLFYNDNDNPGEDKNNNTSTTTTIRDSSNRRLDLQAILHNQMGRAFLKLGDTDAACQNFSCAIQAATIGLSSSSSSITKFFVEENNTNKMDGDDDDEGKQQQKQLEKSIIAAKEGQEMVSQLRFQLQQISDASNCSRNFDDDTQPLQTDLQYIDEALKICDNFDTSLYFDKILLLVQDRRWHEVAYCCENIMSRNVLFDGCFILGDLSSKYPLYSRINRNKNDDDDDDGGDSVPPPPPAKFLTSDFFQSDDSSHQKLLSNPEEVKEGILRLPDALIPYYLKALRLEKRFSAAQAALETLLEGDLSRFGSSVWKEQKILHLILSSFSMARNLYLKGDYAVARICFEDCERFNNSDDNDENKSLPSSACSSGGRFNAMLRYNCAICAMKMMNFGEAINLCTSALTIHPLYMNAIKTRANCYSKLGQVTKAISDYRVWIRLTEQAKKDPNYFWEYRCRFDGPDQVTDDDVSESRKELKKLLTKQQREQEPQKNQYTHHRHRGGEEEEREERGDISSSSKKAETLSYNVLGLKLGASNTEIKKAYRILVLKHHPDKGGATEMFRKIQLAYETLSTNVDY